MVGVSDPTKAVPCSAVPGAHLPFTICPSSRGRSLDGASSPSGVQFCFNPCFPRRPGNTAEESGGRRESRATRRVPCVGRLWEHLLLRHGDGREGCPQPWLWGWEVICRF